MRRSIITHFLLFSTSVLFLFVLITLVALRLLYFAKPSIFGLLYLIVALFHISLPSVYLYYKNGPFTIIQSIIKLEPQWITIVVVLIVTLLDALGVMLSLTGIYGRNTTFEILLNIGFLNLLDSSLLSKGIFLLVAILIMDVIAISCLVLEILCWRMEGVASHEQLLSPSISEEINLHSKISSESTHPSESTTHPSDLAAHPNESKHSSDSSHSDVNGSHHSKEYSSPSTALVEEDNLINERIGHDSQNGSIQYEPIKKSPNSEQTVSNYIPTEQTVHAPLTVHTAQNAKKLPRHLSVLKKILVLISIMISATIFPSGIASIYLVAILLFILLGIFSPINTESSNFFVSKANDYIWFMLLILGCIYTALSIVAMCVAHLWFTSPIHSNLIWELFGFGQWISFRDSWNLPAFIISLTFTLFIMSQACYSYILSSSNPHGAIVLRRRFFSSGNIILVTFLNLMVSLSYFLLLIWFAVMTILVPSMMSLVWLLFLFIGILISPQKFKWFTPFAFVIAFLFLLSLYAFNLPRFMEFIPEHLHVLFYKIGLRHETELKGIPLVAYGTLLILMTLFWRSVDYAWSASRISHRYSSTKRKSNSEESNSILKYNTDTYYNSMDMRESQAEEHVPPGTIASSEAGEKQIEHAQSESIQVNSLLDGSISPMAQEKISSFLRTLFERIKEFFLLCLFIFKQYSFYICLLFIYFVGLSFLKASILHSVYLIIFVIFFVFPILAHKLWFMLVLYTMSIIFALYLYNAFFFDYVPETHNILLTIGLYPFSSSRSTSPYYRSYFTELIWHYLILVFTGSTLYIIRFSSIGKYRLHSFKMDRFSETAKTSFAFFFLVLAKFAYLLTLVTLILIILLHDDVTLFAIGFTVCLFLCLAFSVVFTLFLPLVWTILTFFTCVILCLQYLYQFPYLQELALRFNDIADYRRLYFTIQSIGLRDYPVASLSLFPFAFLIILSVFQLKFPYQIRYAERRVFNSFKDPIGSQVSPILIYIMLEVKLFIQRLCILHHTKFLLIILFISAQLNPTLTGLVYLLAVMLVSPVPSLLSYVWALVVVYSEILILAELVYHLPYFEHLLQCATVSRSSICDWIEWVGFSTRPHQRIIYILGEIFVVVICAHFQKQCLIWKKELRRTKQHLPGKIIEDVNVNSEDFVPSWKRNRVRHFIAFMFNHFFDTFGYEISMFTLLVGALITIQSLWGLIFFVLFGILLFVGKNRLTRMIWMWIMVVLVVELITVTLFIFSMNPFPVYDFTRNLDNIIFRYVKLGSSNLSGWTLQILITQYLILFFMAQQTVSFWRNRRHNLQGTATLLRIEQAKMKKLKVWLPEPKGMKNFTLRQKHHTIYYLGKFLVYNNTTNIVLLIMFIYAAVQPSLIRLLQIMVVIVYLTYADRIVWKTKSIWKWLGLFYFTLLLIQTLFQIPVSLFGRIDSWNISAFAKTVLLVIGFKEMNYFENYWVDILIIVLYYFQERLFDSRGYIFYTNHIYRQSIARYYKLRYNSAFRSGKILKVYARDLYEEHLRRTGLAVLQKYQLQAKENAIIDYKSLYNMYRNIYILSVQSTENALFKIPLKDAIRKLNQYPKYQLRILSDEDRNFMRSFLVKSAQAVNVNNQDYNPIEENFDDDFSIDNDSSYNEENPYSSTDNSIADIFKYNSAAVFAMESKCDTEKPEKVKTPLKQKLKSLLKWILGLVSKFARYIDSTLASSVRVFPHNEKALNRLISRLEINRFRNLTLQLSESRESTQLDVDNAQSESTDDEDDEYESSVTLDPDKDEELLHINSSTPDREDEQSGEENQSLKSKGNATLRNIYHLLKTAQLLYRSNTDILCYFLLALNFLLSPSIYTIVYTVTAFGWAALQYPYPSHYYWYFLKLYSGLLIFLQYFLFILQALLSDYVVVMKFEYWEFLGWRSRSSLVIGIVLNVLLILVIQHHRNNMKAQGDWGNLKNVMKEESKNELNAQLRSDSIFKNTEDSMEEEIDDTSKASNPKSPSNEENDIKKGETFVEKLKRKILFPIARFFRPSSRLGKDYYVIQTLIQILMFILILLSFPLISGRAGDRISEINSSNNINIYLVIMLFVLFIVVCVDRVIYLFHSSTGKLALQVIVLIIVHVLFFVVYASLMRASNSSGVVILQILMLLTFAYLLVSAFQIQSGYPQYTYKDYLMRDGSLYYYAYTVYRLIPFVYEMKTLIDWTFTPTTLTYYRWMQLEDIRATLFVRRFVNISEKKAGRKIGVAQGKVSKILQGFCLFVGLVILLFFPLFFFSNINPALTYNWIDQIDLQLTIPGWSPIFVNNYRILDPSSKGHTWNEELATNYTERRGFSDFSLGEQFQILNSNTYSDIYWTISTPSRESLSEFLRTDVPSPRDVTLLMTYTIHRNGPPSQMTISNTEVVLLNTENRNLLRSMIDGEEVSEGLSLPQMYNPFILNRETEIRRTSLDSQYFPNCTLILRTSNSTLEELTQYFDLSCVQYNLNQEVVTSGPTFFVQSTKIVNSQNAFSLLSGFSILAFYSTFVLTVGRLLRMTVSGLVDRIPFTELDNVNILWALVNDIYIARGSGNLELEERLYREAIRIFRVPSILHYWTRDKDQLK